SRSNSPRPTRKRWPNWSPKPGGCRRPNASPTHCRAHDGAHRHLHGMGERPTPLRHASTPMSTSRAGRALNLLHLSGLGHAFGPLAESGTVVGAWLAVGALEGAHRSWPAYLIASRR